MPTSLARYAYARYVINHAKGMPSATLYKTVRRTPQHFPKENRIAKQYIAFFVRKIYRICEANISLQDEVLHIIPNLKVLFLPYMRRGGRYILQQAQIKYHRPRREGRCRYAQL